MLDKVLSILLLVLPLIVEWVKKPRSTIDQAKDSVNKAQAERLKVYEEILKSKSDELTMLSLMRIQLATKLLRKTVRPTNDGGETLQTK